MWGFSGGMRQAFMADPVINQAMEQAVQQVAQKAQGQMFNTRATLNRVAQNLLENPVVPQQAMQAQAQPQQAMAAAGPMAGEPWSPDPANFPKIPGSNYALPPQSSQGYADSKYLADLAAANPDDRYAIDLLRSLGQGDAQIAQQMRETEATRKLAARTPSASFETWAKRFPNIPLHQIAKATLDPRQDFFNVGRYPPHPRDFQTLVPYHRQYNIDRRGVRHGETVYYTYAPDPDAYARALAAYWGVSVPPPQADQTGLMIRAAASLMGGEGIPAPLRKGAMGYLGGLFGVDATDRSGMRASDLVSMMSPEAQVLAFGSNPQADPTGLPALRSPADLERQVAEAVRGGTMTDRAAADLQQYLQKVAQEQFQARDNTRTLEEIRQRLAGQDPRLFGLISGEGNNPLLGTLTGDDPVTASRLAEIIAAQERAAAERRAAPMRPAAPIRGVRTPFDYGR